MAKHRLGMRNLLGLILIIVAGLALYLRIWSVHTDLRIARRNEAQLQRSYQEALDEAADWRKKYDEEIKKTQDHFRSMYEVTQTLKEKKRNIESLEAERNTFQQATKLLQEERRRIETLENDMKASVQNKESLEKDVARLNEELKKRSNFNKLEIRKV